MYIIKPSNTVKNSLKQSKYGSKDQETIQSSTTSDTGHYNGKLTIKHNIQESQAASPFPAGELKAAINRQESMKNTKHK